MSARVLYTVREDETLFFIEADVARGIRATRSALAACETFGAARRALTPEYFEQLVDAFLAPIEQPPEDDEVLPVDARDEWPAVSWQAGLDALPTPVLEQFALEVDGFMTSSVVIPADSLDDVLEALTARGIACEQDWDLDELIGAEPC